MGDQYIDVHILLCYSRAPVSFYLPCSEAIEPGYRLDRNIQLFKVKSFYMMAPIERKFSEGDGMKVVNGIFAGLFVAMAFVMLFLSLSINGTYAGLGFAVSIGALLIGIVQTCEALEII